MKTLLVIDSSGRRSRSLTRRLTQRFVDTWSAEYPRGTVVRRDVGQTPPPTVNESWIAAAYTNQEERTEAMRDALRWSDQLIDELVAADMVVIGTPIYNFGMPAALKAWVDQVVRVGRTFGFDSSAAEPYRPLLAAKPVVAIVAAGDGSFHPGGANEHLNFLEPHLKSILGFIGLTDVTFVRVGYEEFQDDRLRRSLKAAEDRIDELAVPGSGSREDEGFVCATRSVLRPAGAGESVTICDYS